MMFPGVEELIKKYQARAPAEGVDLLGYYMAPWGYAQLQVLAQAIEATKSLDDERLAQYMHGHSFHTLVGDIAFGAEGEWTEGRPVWVQYHGIKGHDVEQFRGPDPAISSILAPAPYKTGTMIYPYTQARETPTAAR